MRGARLVLVFAALVCALSLWGPTALAAADGDLYGVLGVSRIATPAEIKSAYKKLMRDWHPDRNSHRIREAEAMSQSINQAYDILSDPDKRKNYDLGQEIGPEPTEIHRIESKTVSLTWANYNVLRARNGTFDHIWIVQIYKDSSSVCRDFSPVWEKTAAKFESARGAVFRFGRVHVHEESRLAAEIVANATTGTTERTLPTVFAVMPDGSAVHFQGSRSSASFQRWIESLLPPSLLTAVVTPKEFADFDRAHRDKVRMFVFSAFHTPPFEYRQLAYRLRSTTVFAHVNGKDGEKVKKYFKIKKMPAAMSLAEAWVPRKLKTGFMSTAELESWVSQQALLKVPAITWDNYPATCNTGSLRRSCLLLLTAPADFEAGRSMRHNETSSNATQGALAVRGLIDALAKAKNIPARIELQGGWLNPVQESSFVSHFISSPQAAASSSSSSSSSDPVFVVLNIKKRRFHLVKQLPGTWKDSAEARKFFSRIMADIVADKLDMGGVLGGTALPQPSHGAAGASGSSSSSSSSFSAPSILGGINLASLSRKHLITGIALIGVLVGVVIAALAPKPQQEGKQSGGKSKKN